ncbi:MAG: hypothetical protein Q9177_003290 [Variospora cf. flavescens]
MVFLPHKTTSSNRSKSPSISQPIHYAWNQVLGTMNGHCFNVDAFFIASGSCNAALNLVVFILPIPLLWRLRTTAKQQIVLTIIFTIAGFVLLVSIIWIVVLARLEQADVTCTCPPSSPISQAATLNNPHTGNYINTVIWSVLEPSMAVVCACIPSLRPLYSVAQDHEFRHQHLRPRHQPRVMAASAVAQPDERWPVQPAAGGAGGG